MSRNDKRKLLYASLDADSPSRPPKNPLPLTDSAKKRKISQVSATYIEEQREEMLKKIQNAGMKIPKKGASSNKGNSKKAPSTDSDSDVQFAGTSSGSAKSKVATKKSSTSDMQDDHGRSKKKPNLAKSLQRAAANFFSDEDTKKNKGSIGDCQMSAAKILRRNGMNSKKVRGGLSNSSLTEMLTEEGITRASVTTPGFADWVKNVDWVVKSLNDMKDFSPDLNEKMKQELKKHTDGMYAMLDKLVEGIGSGGVLLGLFM